MDTLFSALGGALEGSLWVSLAAAFFWGVLSVVLSPCHLSSIPLVVAFISGQGTTAPRRALAVASVFSLGILATIALVGLVTAALGRMLGDVGPLGNYVLALVFFLLGLHFLDVIPLPWSSHKPGATTRKGLPAALILGLLFGVAVGPCTFAYMAPMLGIAFKSAAENWWLGASLLAAYGVGHCAVIVLAGTSVNLVQRYLNWTERSRGTSVLRRICGVLVILGGIYLIFTAG